jgi:hypothetical protein
MTGGRGLVNGFLRRRRAPPAARVRACESIITRCPTYRDAEGRGMCNVGGCGTAANLRSRRTSISAAICVQMHEGFLKAALSRSR